MNSQKSTILALLALAATINANTFDGCVTALYEKCVECKERHVLPNGAGCGPAKNKTDNCLIYGLDNSGKHNICTLCKTGYAVKLSFNKEGNQVNTCVKDSVQGCLFLSERVVRNETVRDCVACPNNTYPLINYDKHTYCNKIGDPIKNCMWGGYYGDEKGGCLRCKDGYAVNGPYGWCDPTPGVGCLTHVRGECCTCNYFEGYSIDASGNCFKAPSLA